ncbi:hypothetical protein ACHQM5_004767 [Ranunculus cassubicifolius]
MFQNSMSYVLASLIVSFLVPVVNSSSNEETDFDSIYRNQEVQKLSPKLTKEVIVHGFLLWISVGFLTPIGILVIKMSQIERCLRRLKMLFYFHVTLQILSVLFATVATILSIKNFENAFNNNHQRIGLGLYCIIWLQVLIAFFRPKRGSKQRSMWFFAHWLLGTIFTILGILNIYTGLRAYHRRTSKSIKIWSVLFTIEICCIAFIYLLQDKWLYIKKQGDCLGGEQAVFANQVNSKHENDKDLEQRRLGETLSVDSKRFTLQ